MAAKHKLTVYVPGAAFEEMKHEADRQDRSVSWLVEHCWRLSRDRVRNYPSVNDLYESDMNV